MSVDDEKSVVVNIALAPSSNPANPNENDAAAFFLSISEGNAGTAASFARQILESRCRNVWLGSVCNRCGKDVSTPVELIYGDGYRTIIRRKGASLKELRSLTVGLYLLPPNAHDNVHSALQILPDDKLFPHVCSFTVSGQPPKLYLRTGGPSFGGPRVDKRLSTLEVITSNKVGPWLAEEMDAERTSYPVSLLKGSRKRKKVEPATSNAKKEEENENNGENEKFSQEEIEILRKAYEEEESVEDNGPAPKKPKTDKVKTPKKKETAEKENKKSEPPSRRSSSKEAETKDEKSTKSTKTKTRKTPSKKKGTEEEKKRAPPKSSSKRSKSKSRS